MTVLERAVQIIGESIADEVTTNAYAEMVAGAAVAVDVDKIAHTTARRLHTEGLLA